MWGVLTESETGIVNVVPLADRREHHPSPFCECCPVWRENGVVVHNAFDNRLFLESEFDADVQVVLSAGNN